MDICSSHQRSMMMSRIRSKDTICEKTVRSYLFKQGFRFKLHDRKLPGKPDIVLPKYHAVILVNGCFWHGHVPCTRFRMPKTNTRFWENKIERNRDRDARVLRLLTDLGWRVFVVWECELMGENQRNQTLAALANELWEYQEDLPF